MNDQTAKLIESLAEKLGTTAEYLWSVLVRQAFFSAVYSVIYLVLFLAVGVFLYRKHKEMSVEDKHGYSYYYHNDSAKGFMIVAAFLYAIIMSIVLSFSVENIINGFFNPEYWALHEILNSI